MTLQTTIGLALVGFSVAAQLAFIVLVARASLALRRAMGGGGLRGLSVGTAFRAILPGDGWTGALSQDGANHIVKFGRRVRFALLLVLGVHALVFGIVWAIAAR